VLYDAVSLGNRHSTFSDNLLILYSSVESIENISFHEGAFAIIFRNVNNNNPVTRRHF